MILKNVGGGLGEGEGIPVIGGFGRAYFRNRVLSRTRVHSVGNKVSQNNQKACKTRAGARFGAKTLSESMTPSKSLKRDALS